MDLDEDGRMGKIPAPPTSKLDLLKAALLEMPNVSVREAIEQAADADPVFWCAIYRRLRGHPLIFNNEVNLTDEALKQARKKSRNDPTFRQELRARLGRHRPYLEAPMRDMHRHKAYMKGRQVGVSEAALNEEICFLSKHPNAKFVHTFPRNRQLEDFVRTRLDPAFEETPRMKALLGSPNQMHAKRIKDGYLLLRSAWESNLGEGIDADGVTLDEKDRMQAGVEVAFKECLSSSSWGLFREISTPTIPGRGVHASWLLSDQQHWFVRCSKCGLEQPIEFPDNIVQVKEVKLGTKELVEGSYEYQCRLEKCRGPLDRMRGRWVAKRPGVEAIRGYHMPQTIAVWISATEIMQKRLTAKWIQLFYNYVLGLPNIGENVLLNEQDFEMACSDHQLIDYRTEDWRDICVGIDWGNLNWVVVVATNVHNDRNYVIGLNVFEDDHKDELYSVKRVDSYIAPFEPDIILADAGYGKDRNAYLLRKYGEGRFYAAFYNPSPKASRTFVPVWSAEDGARVLVDRTITLKATCRAVKEREIGLPSYEDHMAALLKKHLEALIPMRIEEEEGSDPIEEIQNKGPDHLSHALAYSLLGLDRLQKTNRFNFTLLG